MILEEFCTWLEKTTFSSKQESSSPKKYKGGVKTISSEMLKKKVIPQPLEDMSTEQLEIAIFNILNNEDFIKKNTKGHNMYSNALKHFRAFLKYSMVQSEQVSDEVHKIETDESIKPTEREALIKSRIGQGKFRNEIMEKYAGTCIISGITDSRLLVASHVKPWSVSDNENRLSKENGILLNYLYDRMFDLGLISFTNEGKILISNELNAENKALSGLKRETYYRLKFTSVLLRNMEYHRDVVFLRG